MLEIGSLAPDFALPNQEGTPTKLSRLLESSTQGVVIYFFVQAGSPGCTREATAFQGAMADLDARGVRVAGISVDPVSDLASFAQQNDIRFDLLSDPDHRTVEEWGAWRGMGTARMTYVLDPGGVVRHVFPRVNVNQHAAEILALFGAAAEQAPAAAAPAGSSVSAESVPELVWDAARASLRLCLAQAAAGNAIPDDVAQLAAEVAGRRG